MQGVSAGWPAESVRQRPWQSAHVLGDRHSVSHSVSPSWATVSWCRWETSSMTRWRSAAWRWPVTVGGVLAVAGLLWVVLVLAPPWFVHDGSLAGLTVQNQVRTTLLQGLGGVALLLGAYFTWRQLRIAREGQITPNGAPARSINSATTTL